MSENEFVSERKPIKYRSKPRPKVSPATRKRYYDARERMGLSREAQTIDWSRVAKRTTFEWKFDTIEDNARWVWQSAGIDFIMAPRKKRVSIMLHYISLAFGIAASDILDRQRNRVFVIPRAIAIALLRKSGMGLYELVHALKRDHTSISNAQKIAARYIEGFQDVSEFKNSCPIRPAFIGEQGRSISS